jgi:hypothetical protein
MNKRKGNKITSRHQKKSDWENLEMARIELNPEQAVLGCCKAGLSPSQWCSGMATGS